MGYFIAFYFIFNIIVTVVSVVINYPYDVYSITDIVLMIIFGTPMVIFAFLVALWGAIKNWWRDKQSYK